MPPRAEDVAIEEAVTPSDAAFDGARFFTSVKPEGQEQQPTEEVSSDDSSKSKKTKKNTSSFNSFLSAVEKDLSKMGKSLEDGFIDAIDRTPLGVSTDKSRQEKEEKESTARTSSVVSSKKKKNEELPSPWYNDAPEEEGSEKRTLDRKGSSVAKAAKKGAVAVGGGALIGVGVVMIPTLPPPFASITMLGGYALLGTEFEGPRNVVKKARDKMRNINDDDDDENEAKEGEQEGEESPSEIEKEFADGENKEMLLSEPQTSAEYWGYGRNESNSETKDSIKNSKQKKKNPVKKTAQKLSKKYVLPALEKVCSAYEKFDDKDKDQVAKEEGFEVVKGEEGEEVTVTNVTVEEQPPASKEGGEEKDEIKDDNTGATEDEVSAPAEEEEGDDEDEEFVDAKEDWIDVDEGTDATASDEDAVLV